MCQPLYRIDLNTLGAVVTAEHDAWGGNGLENSQQLVTPGFEYYNKWYQSSSTSSWVEIDIGTSIKFAGVGFISANDVPARDPESVEFYIDENGSWTHVGTIALSWSNVRHALANVLYNSWYETSKVRFIFTNPGYSSI